MRRRLLVYGGRQQALVACFSLAGIKLHLHHYPSMEDIDCTRNVSACARALSLFAGAEIERTGEQKESAVQDRPGG
jgi:hypothetical protein